MPRDWDRIYAATSTTTTCAPAQAAGQTGPLSQVASDAPGAAPGGDEVSQDAAASSASATPGPVPQAVLEAAGAASIRSQIQQLPALQGLLSQVLNISRLADQKFYLLVVPDDAMPEVLEYQTIEQLVEGIRARLGTASCLFPFLGYRLHISKGPLRWLITPYGQIPLFTSEALSPEPEVSGYVGPDAVDIPLPPTPESQRYAHAASEADPEDDDTPVADS